VATTGRGPALTMPWWYALLAVLVSLLLLGGGGWWYTTYAIGRQDATERENDRRWCELLGTLDEAYQGTPPQSELGRRLAADIHALRTELGCAAS
jgi:hypothetical protein